MHPIPLTVALGALALCAAALVLPPPAAPRLDDGRDFRGAKVFMLIVIILVAFSLFGERAPYEIDDFDPLL